MLKFLPSPIRGIIVFSFLFFNTIFWAIPILTSGFIKFMMPLYSWRRKLDPVVVVFSSCWVFCNAQMFKFMHDIKWDVKGLENLRPDGWYLVISNHQAWTDILVLQTIFHNKIPFLKFFLKKELIWVPIMGLAWWALDYPFMKRYSSSYLKKYPHLKGKDIEITKKACEKFKYIPTSIMNFVEGTRFTSSKHNYQNSPYDNLLRPKAGGIGFVLAAMGYQLDAIINTTIAYPSCKNISFWQFACGNIKEIKVNIEKITITKSMLGNYFEDPLFRVQFQSWINALWSAKDKKIYEMLGVVQNFTDDNSEQETSNVFMPDFDKFIQSHNFDNVDKKEIDLN
ncbi:MAG: acyltransferase [Desulfobacterales bacterium]|nr:acyltransferase [Desulfobacterales bacterium]